MQKPFESYSDNVIFKWLQIFASNLDRKKTSAFIHLRLTLKFHFAAVFNLTMLDNVCTDWTRESSKELKHGPLNATAALVKRRLISFISVVLFFFFFEKYCFYWWQNSTQPKKTLHGQKKTAYSFLNHHYRTPRSWLLLDSLRIVSSLFRFSSGFFSLLSFNYVFEYFNLTLMHANFLSLQYDEYSEHCSMECVQTLPKHRITKRYTLINLKSTRACC